MDLQQPRPIPCSSCQSAGHVECKWCTGTGFFILGNNMLCEVPSKNTKCVICSGKVVCPFPFHEYQKEFLFWLCCSSYFCEYCMWKLVICCWLPRYSINVYFTWHALDIINSYDFRASQLVLIAKELGFVPSGLRILLSTNEAEEVYHTVKLF